MLSCVSVKCVCGHPTLSFGVWECPSIKTHRSTDPPNYRRELSYGSGSPPTTPCSTSPLGDSRINNGRTDLWYKYTCSTTAVLLQVHKNQNMVGRLILWTYCSPEIWVIEMEGDIHKCIQMCRGRETSGWLLACHLWTPMVATMYTLGRDVPLNWWPSRAVLTMRVAQPNGQKSKNKRPTWQNKTRLLNHFQRLC